MGTFRNDARLKSSYLYRLMRPEFVKKWKKPLSSDAFSKFGKDADSSQSNNNDVREATEYLETVEVPAFAKHLDEVPFSSSPSPTPSPPPLFLDSPFPHSFFLLSFAFSFSSSTFPFPFFPSSPFHFALSSPSSPSPPLFLFAPLLFLASQPSLFLYFSRSLEARGRGRG